MDQSSLETLMSRRLFMLGAGKVCLLSLILGRMYYLQITESKKYKLLADKNRISWRFKSQARGRILDTYGKEIASNKSIFNLIIDHDALKNIHALLSSLQNYITLDDDRKEWIIRELKRNPPYISTIAKGNLSWSEVTKIEIHSHQIQGAYIESNFQREYLHSAAFSSIAGYVGTPTSDDVAKDPLLKLPGLRIGRQGVERTYEHKLRGIPSYDQLEVNAHNAVVRKLSSNAGQPGENLTLTIDRDLHLACLKLMEPHRSGSCIIMNVHTGAIKVLISHPGFDSNLFVNGIDQETWQNLQNDLLHPLVNKPASGLYPPGSIMKMLIALAALEEGIIDEKREYLCQGPLQIGSHQFHCWHHHGSVNLERALASSCDIFFYQIGLQLGVQKIANILRRFGFGSATGIDLVGEKKGLVPDKAWKKKNIKTSWYPGDTLNLSIGQGFLTATPLQIVRMMAALANAQYLVTPHLCQEHPSCHQVQRIFINPDHLSLIKTGMMKTIHEPYGTAFGSHSLTGGLLMAGKTGSSQVKRIQLEERLQGLHKSSLRAWKNTEHALFCAFAPYHSPQYAVCVIIDHGGGGGRVAAPIGIQALKLCLQSD